MRTLLKHFCFFSIVSALSLTTIGCENSPESENSIQETLDALIFDLDFAINSNNEQSLQEIINKAKLVRPSSQTQTSSKNMLLSTAREKLANIKIQSLVTETNEVRAKLQLAINQSEQVSILRTTATAMDSKVDNVSADKSKEIENAQQLKLDKYNKQLEEATSELSQLESQSGTAREEAFVLREEGEALLTEADDKGIIEGHRAFKNGVRTIRKSQQIDMSAASIELESQIDTVPMLEDARAELEAIASILNGMENTRDLLRKLKESSKTNAANLLQIADELDNKVAETMNDAIASSSNLKSKWDVAIALIHDSLQSSERSRANSREIQQASAMWKLDLEWTLGNIEEARRNFLLEEFRALTSLIQNGIVTSSNKWLELSNQVQAEVEQSTINAISAFENAKQLAASAGTQTDALANQLNTRILVLQGVEPSQTIVPDTPDYSTGSTQNTSTVTSGFASPQELISAFNNVSSFGEMDGTSPAPNLSLFYNPKDEESNRFIDFLQEITTSGANILIAIRTNMGADAVSVFKSSQPSSGMDKVNLDSNSLTMNGDNKATVVDIAGITQDLEKTSDGWKISLSNSSEAVLMASMIIDMLGPMVDFMNNITDQINNGQITTIKQIEDAFALSMGAGGF